MQCSPLSAVRSRIQLGMPVPFNIRGPDHRLLLARGQVIRDEDQLDALFRRDAVAEAEPADNPRAEVKNASVDKLPSLWSSSIDRLGRALLSPALPAFAKALADAAEPVLALVERDPDLAIFQVVRQEAACANSYGVSHSVHAAIAGYLVAQRLGWDQTSVQRLFKAGLTMNLAIVELQSRLATQLTPLTAVQKQTIREHPTRSMEILQASGVTDIDWLAAVADHHESQDGKGYPRGCSDVGEMAGLLRRVDVYTAKLSSRNTRAALLANRAGRDLFVQDGQHPMAAAVVKEFGVYPPGCLVQLQCGEVGLVVKRGARADTPLVASLMSRSGDALMEPVRRETERQGYGVVAAMPESSLRVRVSPEKLVVLASS